ncbi:collagenase [Thalassotalea ganghwensis]
MKINQLLVASCLLLVGGNAFAGQKQSAPQPPKYVSDLPHEHHGIEKVATIDSGPNRRRIIHPRRKRVITNSPIQSFTATHSKFNSINSMTVNAIASCDLDALMTSNTATLISELKTQGSDCINSLFSASSDIQSGTYNSSNMTAVATHVQGLSQTYTGGGNDDIESLFLYLRAGFFVEFYNDAVTFQSSVKPAVQAAIDSFVNNANFYQNNDAHGKTLSEVIITMDSAELQDVYLPVVKEWLVRWDQSYADKWYMRNAVNGIFTILFRGQWNDKFVALVGNDTELVTRLKNFALKSWMLDSESEFIVANAARELGRLKTYSGTAIQPSVDAALNEIFNSSYQLYGYGDAVWLGAADTATYFADCSDFGICGYKAQLEAQVLSQIYTCSPTIKVRSQDLTQAQQVSACSTMGAEETYFHNRLATNNQPVADDNNSQLQVNIFNSSDDYGKYAGHIFGIDTNNGGMYLEGDPSNANNIPNFVAYEADYAKPDHYVWNLEHEYVHYLDGRFDLYGDFNAPTEAIVWWTEGVAEYIAKQNNNQAAIDTITDGSTYTLATVIETTYDGFDQDRIYRWGYLAVRFMFEKHFDEVQAMLAETRAGNWSAYKTRVSSWATSYGNEFTQWTQALASGSENIAPTANANGPYNAIVNTDISFSSANSNDSDGSIISYAWDFGDGNNSTEANPTHRYSQAGTYTATLTVTDNENSTGTSSAIVTITSDNTTTELDNNSSVSNLSASAGQWLYYTLAVPQGATDLSIATAGGNGDVDLYTQLNSQPTTNAYQCRPYLAGNTESCTNASPQAGVWHIGLYAYNDFDGVTLSVSYTDDSTSNEAPVAVINGPYSASENQVINFSSEGSSDTDGTITAYLWNFGDGNTATDANPSHSYSGAGNYTVTLTVTDNLGSNHSVNTTAQISAVNQAPIVEINGPYTGEQNIAINFNSNGSYDADGTIASYLWNFGDGSTSSQANPTHSYNTSGSYTVSLTVTDNEGLTNSTTTTATISGDEIVTLTNGSSLNISGQQNQQSMFQFDVPANATNLSFRITGGSGDADIYVSFGEQPTLSSYDCRPYLQGNEESCEISNIQAGTYYVMVRGYNSYNTNLIASHNGSSTNVPNACLSQGAVTSGRLETDTAYCMGTTDPMWFSVAGANEHTSIAITIAHGTGNAAVLFSNYGWPDSNNTQASSDNAGNNECIYLSNLSEYWGYIKVTGGAENASIIVDYDTAGCR